MGFEAAAVLAAFAVAAAACAVASAQGKLGRLVVTGVVPCNTGSLIDVATSPAFPDAKVELRCGGGVVAGATTSQNGSFAMEADVTSAVAVLVGACELVVDTPLAKCDARLPASGKLVSYVQQGSLARLLDGALRLAPAGFSFRMA
ncbi:hypothetical protein E2562_023711 [Oryza meyeriana var. granulata]|uniref:Phylloplanin n=1 Tax=Oryza meyeriana var. granulata TaxID=110450 RepID=A0A6G1DM84_9ORYZ|nr:hypothetical protein E2562_023711 [Oryza meyeriana var. granulata]